MQGIGGIAAECELLCLLLLLTAAAACQSRVTIPVKEQPTGLPW